jgi:hypothetical protein
VSSAARVFALVNFISHRRTLNRQEERKAKRYQGMLEETEKRCSELGATDCDC